MISEKKPYFLKLKLSPCCCVCGDPRFPSAGVFGAERFRGFGTAGPANYRKSMADEITGGTARHFSANYMPFAGAEVFLCEHACLREEIVLGHFLICGAGF